jgi:hypothetical protein
MVARILVMKFEGYLKVFNVPIPPSPWMTWPVIQRAASESKKYRNAGNVLS